MNIPDFAFNAILNLSAFPNYKEVISRCVYTYLNLWVNSKTICNIDNIDPEEASPEEKEYIDLAQEIEVEILVEGINEDLPPKVRSKAVEINLFFRLEIFVLPLLIVGGQNLKNPICIMLFLFEFFSLAYFFKLRLKIKKPIFDGWLSFISFLLVKVVIMMFGILGIFLDEWHTN